MGISPSNRRALLFEVCAWPLMVSATVMFLGYWAEQSVSARMRWVILVLFVATALGYLAQQALYRPPFSSLPTFYGLFAAAW